MKGLTKRQQEILQFIKNYLAEKEYSPSFKEIGEYFGFSSLGSVYNHIKVLKRKGLLVSESATARSLLPASSTLNVQNNVASLPLVGFLSAGIPLDMFSNPKFIEIPRFFLDTEEKSYLVQVKGDSLIEEAMLDGDLVIVEARTEAQPGDLVVALVNEHDTLVKRYFPESPYIRLESQNPHVSPMILRESHLHIQGVVVGVLRMRYL